MFNKTEGPERDQGRESTLLEGEIQRPKTTQWGGQGRGAGASGRSHHQHLLPRQPHGRGGEESLKSRKESSHLQKLGCPWGQD